MEIEMTSRALSGQKSWCDFDIDFVSFPSLRVVKSELTPTPAAAALVVLINVLRFIILGCCYRASKSVEMLNFRHLLSASILASSFCSAALTASLPSSNRRGGSGRDAI